jgi:hypothetical protein
VDLIDPDARFPVVRWRRALVPGVAASVRTSRSDLHPGTRVVMAHERDDGSTARVGTLALITASRDSSFGGRFLDVTGDRLVACADAAQETRVAAVDTTARELPLLVRQVRDELRRYMAARAEAGVGGDVHVEVPEDPIVASHRVASHLEVTWPELQDVLEAGDAAARLEREVQLLRRETALLRAVLAHTE